MSFLTVDLKASEDFTKFLKLFPQNIDAAAKDAINTTARFAYAEASREIRKQTNFTQSYIGSADSGNRLKITKRATPEDLQAVIAAQTRPVSLARFVLDKTLKKKGVSVAVKPGSARPLPGAFLVRLRSGKQITEDQFNLGLAIRVKPGTTLNKRLGRAKPFSSRDPNLLLLYGPSVDQVFQTVRADISPQVSDFLSAEFSRQFNRHF